jgi:hypothetical protein
MPPEAEPQHPQIEARYAAPQRTWIGLLMLVLLLAGTGAAAYIWY